MITGKDLVAMGCQQGKWFAEALAHINSNALEGEDLTSYLKGFETPAPLELHAVAAPFFQNIEVEDASEQLNVASVLHTMQQVMRTPTVVGGAIMPDACPAGPVGTIPVGGVVVAHKAIHPGMHSADICCSLMLTNLGQTDPKLVLDAAQKTTHFGFGGRNAGDQFELPKEIWQSFKSNYLLNNDKILFQAKSHLGTQGDGNHFLYVGTLKSTGDTVLVTHHGSRGVGASLYKIGMGMAEKFRKILSPATYSGNAWIPSDSEEGQLYWEALQIVRAWTKENHICLHDAVAKKLKVVVKDRFWNEHNFVFKQGDLFYHAKGATPVDKAFMPDITGPQIIPLNMAASILLVQGETTSTNLGFAPHGAGRNMSRSKHKILKSNMSVKEIFALETAGIDARFYTNRIDISELPSAYKNANSVKAQIQKFDLAQVVEEIMPFGCIMAGDLEEAAPWRKKKK